VILITIPRDYSDAENDAQIVDIADVMSDSC